MTEAVLVRWTDEALWHFTPSTLHASTACGLSVPFKEASPQHAEIDLLTIESFKGLCKRCFHEMCIDTQDRRLWDLYYERIAPHGK